jgi:hypothetical protein
LDDRLLGLDTGPAIDAVFAAVGAASLVLPRIGCCAAAAAPRGKSGIRISFLCSTATKRSPVSLAARRRHRVNLWSDQTQLPAQIFEALGRVFTDGSNWFRLRCRSARWASLGREHIQPDWVRSVMLARSVPFGRLSKRPQLDGSKSRSFRSHSEIRFTVVSWAMGHGFQSVAIHLKDMQE